MKMKFINLIWFFCILFSSSYLIGQDDPVLFSVNNKPVHVSEFNYIYLKNNGEEADYSKESLEEYLELYKKFKLKVEKARDMGLDTIQRLVKELDGYKSQLSSSYLVDKEVSEKLIDEVVERKKSDVRVSHIFVAIPPKAKEATLAKNEEKVMNVYSELKAGKSFEELAKTMSEDKASGARGGDLGYNVSMLPNGFYEFENAMYSVKVGDYSQPVKSALGWHIIKVTDKRPSRAEMEVSHILIKKKDRDREIKDAKGRAEAIYKMYQEGQTFEDLAKTHSQDKKTADKGGYLGFFKINQYEANFEDAAYNMKDGEVSQPIETAIGWHIIKKHSTKDQSDDEKIRRQVQAGMTKTERFGIAKTKLIEKIKDQIGVEENIGLLNYFAGSLNDDFFTYKWKIPQNIKKGTLVKIDNNEYTLPEFATFCKKNSKERLQKNKKMALKEAVNELYSTFVNEKILEYEEKQLPKKYPEFKALMREYEEGILLFEATKMEVWDKASTDTIGLEKYYNENKEDYKWDEKLEVEEFVILGNDEKLAKSIHKKSKKTSKDSLLEEYNADGKNQITVVQKTIEKSDPDAKYNWSENQTSKLSKTPEGYSFYKTKSIIPSSYKKLDEARGYIIADYQDVLEKRWIKELMKEYPIEINQDVFNDLIRS